LKANTEQRLLKSIVKGLEEKKAHQVNILNLKKIDNAVCDYFVICHGSSTTQVGALADAVVEESLKSCAEKPIHREGLDNMLWVLLDYGNIVVHIFEEGQRPFYKLEELWADAKPVKLNIN
jgi:ribosome-associated protein